MATTTILRHLASGIRKNLTDSLGKSRLNNTLCGLQLAPVIFLRALSRLSKATISEEHRLLQTQWSDGASTEYPLAWLRDNCQCPKCFLKSSKSRMLLMKDFDPEIKTNGVQVQEPGDDTTVTWVDGHVSTFKADWLWENRFTTDARAKRKQWLHLKPKLWNRDSMQGNIPTDKFENIMNSERSLFRWLCHVEQDGLFLITDAPTDEGLIKNIAERVSFLKQTIYGTVFSVKTKPDPNNTAYTSATLGFHTDLPYYEYSPGVQVLHCIKQAEIKGGENQFVDGFYAAEQLRSHHPEHFETLTTVPVDFYDIGQDYSSSFKILSTPAVSVSDTGEVTKILYNDQTRYLKMSIPVEKVNPLYLALKAFDNILYHRENHVEMKLKDGDIVCFNNQRLLHGRTGYEVTKGSERHLTGCYIDWDEAKSRRRVLQLKHGFDPIDCIS